MDIIKQLRREEGSVPHAYLDSLGYWTIGVGRLIDQRRGGGLSESEIDLLLTNDVSRIMRELRESLPWVEQLDDARRAVLVGMAFQMGTAGLMQFTQTLASVRDQRYMTAAAQMLQSKWAQQTPARARRMSRQMESGEWQA